MARSSEYQNEIVWKNKYFNIKTKLRIYKTSIRPIMTYAVEIRPDIHAILRIMRTVEVKSLRGMQGKVGTTKYGTKT